METWELICARVPHTLPIAAGAVGGRVILYGYSLEESTGLAPARVALYDSTAQNGPVRIPIPMPATGAAEDWFGPQGVLFRNGLFVAITAGSVDGSLFIYNDYPGED